MALPELFSNSPTPGSLTALTTLGAAVTSGGAGTITTSAAAPAALQAAGQFRIVIDSEIMIVTAGAATTTWTVTRGAESSTATTHLISANIYHFLTAAALGGQSDAAAAVPSIRSLGKSSVQAAPGDQTEYAFSSWKTVEGAGFGAIGAGVGANTYIYAPTAVFSLASVNSGQGAFYLDPADFAAGTRTVQCRVRGWVLCNSVAPAVTFTFGLYPIATWGTASGAVPTIATVSAAAASVAIATPAASSDNHAESSAVTFPSAGWYCLAVVTSGGSTAASSSELTSCRLQMRQV